MKFTFRIIEPLNKPGQSFVRISCDRCGYYANVIRFEDLNFPTVHDCSDVTATIFRQEVKP